MMMKKTFEEDGIAFETEDLGGKTLNISATYNGRTVKGTHRFRYTPVFGYDIEDVQEANALVDSLKKQLLEEE